MIKASIMSGTYGQMKLQITDIISQSKGTGKRKSRIDTGITESEMRSRKIHGNCIVDN